MPIDVIDPNEINNNRRNGVPDYSQMMIFVELLATRRESTILNKKGTIKEGSVEKVWDSLTVSMLGFDTSTQKFTTRYTDNDATSTHTEGFGISNISVLVNSSYVPQVDIEFIDNRGLSLFNGGKESPYAVLHSFPPPLFQLTIKGYYGAKLTYDLHLVSQNTKFDPNTGNYQISAKFVGRTYAPLTDVLMKYVEIAPYMLQPDAGSSSSDVKTPTNTLHDFILKSKKLYEQIGDITQNSEEVVARQRIIDKSNGLISVFGNINNFPNSFLDTTIDADAELLNKGFIFIYNTESKESTDITKNLAAYDNLLRTKPNKSNTDNKPALNRSSQERLYLSYKISGIDETKKEHIKSKLKVTRNGLLEQANKYSNTVIGQEDIKLIFNEFTVNNDTFLGIDCGDFVQKITVQQRSYIKQVDQLNDKLGSRVETKVSEQLKDFNQIVSGSDIDGIEDGFKPTIANIFRILCNDIDKFFQILKKTAEDAETHHENNKSTIFNQLSHTLKNENVKKIYPFPTYTEEIAADSLSKKRTKAYPGKIVVNPQFPEVRMVEDFVNAFTTLKQQDRNRDFFEQEDEVGNKKWIPISPVDSILANENNKNSPYFGLKNNPGVQEFFNLLYNRFIAYSQYFFAASFYETPTIILFNRRNSAGMKYETIRQLILEAETLNIVNSLDNDIVINAIKEYCIKFTTDPTQLYEEFKRRNIKLANKDIINVNGISLYKDKTKTGDTTNESIMLIDAFRLTERISTGNSEDPIEKFIDENKAWIELFEKKNKPKKFTADNVIFYEDTAREDDYFTNYILPATQTETDEMRAGLLTRYRYDFTLYDDAILSILQNNNYDRYAKAFFLASNFGQNNIQRNIYWGIPAALKIPKFLVLFLGGYVYHYFRNDDEAKTQIETLFQDFTNRVVDISNSNSYISVGRVFNFQNEPSREHSFIIEELLPNLTFSDRQLFLGEFLKFVDGEDEIESDYDRLKNSLTTILTENVSKPRFDTSFESLNAQVINGEKYANYGLALNSGNFRSTYFDEMLMKDVGLIIFGENAFYEDEVKTYKDLDELHAESEDFLEINNEFFKQFFKKLDGKLNKVLTDRSDDKAKVTSQINDNDIKSQCYYSFKSIYDKWLAGGIGLGGDVIFADNKTQSLFDSFVFVDRSFNDIGDKAIIDFKPLIEASEDYDMSVFTAISRLLAHNNFEFFPLQNFMAFKGDDWGKIFQTVDNLDTAQRPAFICMYVGGTSTQLNDPNSDYKNDSFNLNDSSLPTDFNNDNIRAFKVQYGIQNQSFFKEINIDTVEHKDTNESLVILSKLAEDKSQSAPVPKGQNLFNTYETRSYTTTVKMIGNAMIQPTQYFQLEGIPMFSGAYMILEVVHDIKPNTMETTFRGVRMLAYPAPIVTDISSVSGFLGNQNRITQDITGSPTPTPNVNARPWGEETIGADYIPNVTAGAPVLSQSLLKISP